MWLCLWEEYIPQALADCRPAACYEVTELTTQHNVTKLLKEQSVSFAVTAGATSLFWCLGLGLCFGICMSVLWPPDAFGERAFNIMKASGSGSCNLLLLLKVSACKKTRWWQELPYKPISDDLPANLGDMLGVQCFVTLTGVRAVNKQTEPTAIKIRPL